MSDNGNNPHYVVATPQQPSRVRASGPILIVAVLFVIGSFLAWYFTWFGRELSDADVSKYLLDDKNPRHVQHALLQIQQRMERGDTSVRQWYPNIVSLSGNPETEIRLTVSWLMGCDNQSEDFHAQLKKLLNDEQPIVRRNAALALVRFNDNSGHEQIRSIFQNYEVRAPADGMLTSSLNAGSRISRGALLARVVNDNSRVQEVRSPLPATIENRQVESDARVTTGQVILTLRSDEQSVWEGLRAMAIVGQPDDLPLIQPYVQGSSNYSDQIQKQAARTASAIQGRNASTQ